MLERMTADELSEWHAFYRLEPFGEERADLRNGIVASILVNTNLKKGAKATTPLDFMPFADKKSQDASDQKAQFKQFTATMKARQADPSDLPEWAVGRSGKGH